jgi:uncharacterized protein YqjF (DUF2071 family)
VDSTKAFLSAEWRYLAMLNYEVDATLLLPFLPNGTELDRWNGKMFVSLVAFRFLKTKVLGLRVPFHSDFNEVNLRFYVRRKHADEARRGVVFIREIVPRWAIAYIARTFYNENYIAVPMAYRLQETADRGLAAEYRWRGEAWNSIRIAVEGDPVLAPEGSQEQFITEHYWGYAAQPDGSCMEYQVTHPPWRVWNARHATFDGEIRGLFGSTLAAALTGTPTSAFLAEGSAVEVMRGGKLSQL